MRVYGPYTRKDGRKHVILYENGVRTTMSYPKYLMEQYLGRNLQPWETVDHIDEDFTNDSLDNLQILSVQANIDKSRNARGVCKEYITFICIGCGQEGTQEARNVRHNRKLGKAGPFCSRSCAGKYSQRRGMPTAEQTDLKSVGCGFESHSRHP